MNFQKIVFPLVGVVMIAVAYNSYGWGGVAIVVGAIVMWGLLHFTRMVQVMQRAGKRPIGYVDSAVMLNAKLKIGMALLHVIAMTRALGELRSPKDTQPEVFRWTDGSQSFVDCEFRNGKLVTWRLERPAQDAAAEPAEPAPAP